MKLIKSPFRISFFGGGCDFPEYFNNNTSTIIGTSIEKYVYITFSNIATGGDYKYNIFYKNIEKTNSYKNIKLKPLKFFFAKFDNIKNIEIHIISDLPNRSGIGSSSAFIVGLMTLKNLILNLNFNSKSIAKESYKFERNDL